ncbi:hypothetical protein DVH24_023561 [Malus domestica]|uniref:Uncharacterized protein n=1 Tax=Malus domestica TaxID=3750 RepID=A0A498I5R5_MALDO|nr:hypothetical protein DVH24_023561 [Malus domestica]
MQNPSYKRFTDIVKKPRESGQNVARFDTKFVSNRGLGQKACGSHWTINQPQGLRAGQRKLANQPDLGNLFLPVLGFYSLSLRAFFGSSRTQCTRLPLYAGSGRGECRLALPPFMKRLLPSLEPETYRSWAKALAIAPSATSFSLNLKKRKKKDGHP